MPKINGVPGELSLNNDWVGVVVLSVLASAYQSCHETPNDRSVFELVAACAKGYIETAQ